MTARWGSRRPRGSAGARTIGALLALGVAFGCLALPQIGWAATRVLTFEGLRNGEAVGQFYDGGAGSLGSVGPDHGVEFGAAAIAVRDADAGGSGNFANEPSPDTTVSFRSGPGVVMNVADGIRDGFSFFYSSGAPASVNVYDGLDATGTLLATLPLSTNFNHGGCIGDPTGIFCNWDPVGVTFEGTAHSVNFGATANRAGLDDITLGSAIPGEQANGAPVADAGGPYAGVEGAAIAVDGSATTDPDGDDLTYAWTVTSDAGNDAGSGCTVADPTSAQTTISCNDDGSYTATLAASDGSASHSDSAAVAVANADPQIQTPTLTGAGGPACATGNAVSLSFAVTDAGALDEADLTGTVDWGDGTTESYSGTSFAGAHSYAAGTYTITATADDHDGGTDSASATVRHEYLVGDFQPPVRVDGSSAFKLGSTIPVKIAVVDCNGARVSTSTLDVDLTHLDSGRPVEEVESSSGADVADDMRWTGDKYMYNLSTKRSRFCRPGAPFCAGSALTTGAYELRVSDEAANDAFAPALVRFTLR